MGVWQFPWRKVIHTITMVRTEAIASLRYQESGDMTGMIQIITADITTRPQVAGWEVSSCQMKVLPDTCLTSGEPPKNMTTTSGPMTSTHEI